MDRYGNSEIVQYLYFYPDQYRFDIRNEIDWAEDHVLLRDYFPVDIMDAESLSFSTTDYELVKLD